MESNNPFGNNLRPKKEADHENAFYSATFKENDQHDELKNAGNKALKVKKQQLNEPQEVRFDIERRNQQNHNANKTEEDKDEPYGVKNIKNGNRHQDNAQDGMHQLSSSTNDKPSQMPEASRNKQIGQKETRK